MSVRALTRALAIVGAAFMATSVFATSATAQETIRLRIASGHAPAEAYVRLMQNYFVPEVVKRVAARTKHKIEFVEGYGGSMVKVADTLEGVQSGIIDIGGYCFCFEPSNLPLHAFQVILPFGPMDPVTSIKVGRAVYDANPYLIEVFEKKFRQKLIGLITFNGYNLATNFEWNKVSDLKGVKIAGAGLNLKWLEFAGAVPVQTSLPEVYTSLKTGVYNGVILFPSAMVNFKLHEVSRYYTEIGFGATAWAGLTINTARFERLPKEVQAIILEVGRDFEAQTGLVNAADYPKQLKEFEARGGVVRRLPDDVRQQWAESLSSWPAEKAKELDALGLPATQVLESAIKAAEDMGYKWPVRYRVR
jgi:C4-dicarboxylate-binding protein DctP